METVKNTMHNIESNSTSSHINGTDTNEISKEREEELLFGREEDGDDEDTLSDDSLRLRLSEDEDIEQEEERTVINHIISSEHKSQSRKIEQLSIITAEEKSRSDPQQVVEETTKSGNEKLVRKEQKAINVPENSALHSDEYTLKNKQPIQNNVHNLENSNTTIVANKLHEKYTLNISNKMKDNYHDEETSEVNDITNDIKNESQFSLIDYDKNIVAAKILNNDWKGGDNEVKCISKPEKNLKNNGVSTICTSAVSEKYTLEDDNLYIENCIKLSNGKNIEQTIHNEDNLQKTNNDCNTINSTDTYRVNNLDVANSNNSSTDPVKVKICNSEKMFTTMTVLKNNDPDLTKCDKIVDKIISNDTHSVKCLLSEIYNSQNSNNSIDISSSCEDSTEHKNKRKNREYEDTIQCNTSEMQFMQQDISDILTQNLSDAKGNTEVTNANINKTIQQIINTKSTSTKDASLVSINVEDINNENEINDIDDTIVQRKKRLKKHTKLNIAVQDCATQEDKQEESGRQKRRTAKNAEEIIRKKYLNSDSDSSDSSEQLITLYNKVNQELRPTSPPSLKRNCSDENPIVNGVVKKVKMSTKPEEKRTNNIAKLSFIEKFFQRDDKDILQKFTQEELEELLIQKIVETITMRSEIGQLREQARISEKNQEAARVKLQQLTKQVKDFEMVLSRNAIDRRTNPDKFVAPIKINRSVGLQVNFITEHGMQNLRQIQQNSHVKTPNVSNSINPSTSESNNHVTSPRRGIKIRSPRRSETSVTASTSTISQSPMQTTSLISTVTPAALVVAKPLESQHTLTLSNQPSGVQQILPAANIPQQQVAAQHQAIVLNGKIQNPINRPGTTLIAPKPRNDDLIDLTDEEEKSKTNVKPTVPTTAILEQQLSTTSKPAQCFQRVIQTIPTNVAITTQPASIRLVQPNQSTATALVNNITPPRLTYVMQSGTTRQVLITSNANQIRPVTTCRPTYSTVTYKTGISTIANGTVRVLTTPAVSNVQINKHPAPLPDTPNYAITAGWKLPPPAPSLKISKVSNGIVLSWNMNLSDKYADIASYQLYAYQEVPGVNPSTALWKKVGDVRALPLPMACTLTQFSEGNNYYFAVRAVDTHSRKGQYSIPGNISL